MAQDLVINGETYEGVEQIAATNTEGDGVLYLEEISSIEKTSGDGSPGTFDIYTVTLIDGSTRNVLAYNGKDGDKGDPGKDGTVSFSELTDEQRASLRGEKGASASIITRPFEESGRTGYILGITSPGADGKDEYKEVKLFDGANALNGLSSSIEVLSETDEEIVFRICNEKRAGGSNVSTEYRQVTLKKTGTVDAVQYVPQELTEEQKAQARENIGVPDSDIFIAQFPDTTYAEIKAAHDAGKACFARSGNGIFTLTQLTDEKALFIAYSSGVDSIGLTFASDGKHYAAVIHSGAVMYSGHQPLSNDEKTQARKNIGAVSASDVQNGAGAVVVSLSGTYDDGFTVTLDGAAVTGDTLDEKAQAGAVVIGVAESEMMFHLPTGLGYRVPKGTLFRYDNAVVSFEKNTHAFEFRVQMEDNDFAVFYESGGWVGKAKTTHITFYLLRQYADDKMIRFNDERLTASEAFKLLFDSVYRSRPIFCYQENAAFFEEDGTEHTPDMYVPFYFNSTDFSFRCERDGYEYTLLISPSDGYTPTAKKNTPYRTAESKADDMEVEEGSLFLLSAGERITSGVPMLSGPQGPPGESGVTAPVNGFFTLSVDADGNLWAYSAEDGTTPDFEYDSETGNLYFVTEQE